MAWLGDSGECEITMSLELIVQRRADGKTFDISELIGSIEWSTDIEGQPGKLTFEYLEDSQIIPTYGDIVRFRYKNQGIFFGRVFTKKRNSTKKMEVTAYDQMRYLKNEDTYVLNAMTSSNIFRRICLDAGLNFRVVDASPFTVAAKIHDKVSLFDIIQDALDQTLVKNREWYIIRDNFGTLEHVHLNRLQTGLIVGDNSMATDFEFQGSIDDDTYNRVKLVRENQETQKREIYMVLDSRNIGLWGPLQYHEKVDENLNYAQIKSKAERILQAKNRPTRSLKIPALGDVRISAGNGVVLSIAKLRNEGFKAQEYALVSACKHNWSGSNHTMDLTIKVV